MQKLLETDRLTLRRLTADDFDALVELAADPEVTRYITGGHPGVRSADARGVAARVRAIAGVRHLRRR
jgi:RimJ/RimL family protein N-acetyltransferase